MSETICVVGLGYVGLPLATAFDDAGHHVVGYDVDEEKIETLRTGIDTTGDIGDAAVADGDVHFTSDPVSISDASYVIVTVPTPIDDLHNPNLEYVTAAGRTVGENMAPGTTVVLESTVYPGATRNELVPALEDGSGMVSGKDFQVGYSPERMVPGDSEHGLANVVKVVGADDDDVREDLVSLYETIVDAGVYRAESIETAETAKVLENVQRDLNIALVNELAIVCDRIGLDTHAVLEAARTKWNFHDYRPGLVGGHCIPVDPFYLTYRSEREGFSPKLILTGREINEYMPKHTAEVALKALNRSGNVLRESRVLVLGLAYKPNVGDIRTSEVGGVIDYLQEFGVEVVGYDPHADPGELTEEFGIEVQEELSFEGFDGVVLATPHDEFSSIDPAAMAESLSNDPIFLDVMGAWDRNAIESLGVSYRRL